MPGHCTETLQLQQKSGGGALNGAQISELRRKLHNRPANV